MAERLALDEFGDGVQIVALAAARRGFHHVRVADALRDPVLHEESFEVRVVALQLGGERLDDHRRGGVVEVAR